MKTKLLIAFIMVLVGTNIYLYAKWSDLHYNQLYYDKAVPHLELIAAMAFYGVDSYQGEVLTSQNSGDIAIGSITGFVTFPNLEDQPRGAWQYYKIQATSHYDTNGLQLFELTETLKMTAIPPKAFDPEVLKVTGNTAQTLTLETESGQTFRIDKRTDNVTVVDGDGDVSTLVTNQSDYKDFMLKFLD